MLPNFFVLAAEKQRNCVFQNPSAGICKLIEMLRGVRHSLSESGGIKSTYDVLLLNEMLSYEIQILS